MSAASFVPPTRSLARLRRAAADCRGCDLYKRATQTVFGDGARGADILFIGEQPGDKEDLLGRPFVGPAGSVLRRALADAGMTKTRVYVTNAVKHFRYLVRGKRRIHQKPKAIQIEACKPWLDAEIRSVQPKAVVALGVTAARSLLGGAVKIEELRGGPIRSEGDALYFVTIHPANILRQQGSRERDAAFEKFVRDLRLVAGALTRQRK